MNKPLYIVRGTGMVIDGTIVNIVEDMGDYSIISQPNLPESKNIMVKTKCLQPIGEIEPVSYKICVTKYERYEDPDSMELFIDSAVRNVDLGVIIEFLERTITPILRMEQ